MISSLCCAVVVSGCGHGNSLFPQTDASYSGPVGGPGPVGPLSPDIADTTTGFHAIQIFDDIHGNFISIPEATANGGRYGAVWGSRQATVYPWQENNPNNRPLLYTPFDTDSPELGQSLTWWQINHPDWILYECDKRTVAYVPGLPEVPLDISNPSVAAYQAVVLGAYAEVNGYNGLGADIVDLTNNTGHARNGAGGCGVWNVLHTVWKQKFSGQYVDSKWSSAVVSWATTEQRLLHQYPRRLALAVNAPPGAYTAPVQGKGGDPAMRALFDHTDIELDEAGFALWGQYADNGTFVNVVGWMEYAQSKGKAFFLADDWNAQKDAPSIHQLDYSLATYMMGKEQAAALYVGKNVMYGKENFYEQYRSQIGRACSPMYGGPSDPHYRGEKIYLRKYTGALAIANVSPRDSYRITLPKRSYTNIEGGIVRSPLTVTPNTGYVLLTTNGCY